MVYKYTPRRWTWPELEEKKDKRAVVSLPALAPNDSQGVHPDAAGPVLGMAEAMSHWGDAKPMHFAKGELD